MHYYGTRLSENISKREPEGYLLCLNVPVARTGTQEYLPEELGLPPATAGGGNLAGGNLTRNKRSPQCGAAPIEGAEVPPGSSFIQVFRPEEEVFSPETIASFEGMPVTNDHPPEGVDVSNIRALQKGHAHNVRRGSGKESDLLLADLIITDPVLIDLILNEGKREISCGYTYELCEENGQLIQRKIRGNHVAVVDAGRAGPRVCIHDEQPSGPQPGMRRSHHKTTHLKGETVMKKSLVKKLVRMAKDGDPEAIEAVAELLEETAATEGAEETVRGAESEAAKAEEENTIAGDEDGLAGILERLDQIIALLTPVAADEDPAESVAEVVEEVIEAAEAGDPLTEQVAETMEEILDPVASVILESETDEEETELPESLQAGDALRAALKAVRPALARMPRNQRKKAAADIAARLRRSGRGTTAADAYNALRSAARRTAPASADLGRRIMEKRNATYRKGV